MTHTFRKTSISEEWIKECKKHGCVLRETPKTVTIKYNLSEVQEAMLQNGQLTKKGVLKSSMQPW